MSAKWKYALTVIAGCLTLLIVAGVASLKIAPPDLIRVGANYTAKIVCTNVFMVGRQADEVLEVDVQAPGHPMLRLMQVDVDTDKKIVRANILGLFGRGLAVYRPGTGCAAVPDGDVARAKKVEFIADKIPAPSDSVDWPAGAKAVTDEQIQQIIQNDQLAGPGMRGIAVIHDGKLIAQRYGKGFNERTPLIGWSMSKTVNAVLVGMQIGQKRLALNEAGFWIAAQPTQHADARVKIKLADLLAMSSGLQFNEDYGDVSDVTRMLFLTSDMSAFVHDKPLEHPPGSFWNYSTGTSVLLARLWQDQLGEQSLRYPHDHLFASLGMSSAFMEADESGTLVGGSYVYATAQDWARFGQLLMQNGRWNDRQLVPESYVAMMHTAAQASGGKYGQGQLWLEGPDGDTPRGVNPDTEFHFPSDTYWLQGHDGQTIAIIPSQKLVVVRLGLTPRKYLYKPQYMLAAIIKKLS